MVGNKIDLFAQEEVSEEEARAVAKENNITFKLVSAANGDGIDDLFMSMVKLYESKPKKINESGEECLDSTSSSFSLRKKKKKEQEQHKCCS